MAFDLRQIELLHEVDRQRALEALDSFGVKYKDTIDKSAPDLSRITYAIESGLRALSTGILAQVGDTVDNAVGSDALGDAFEDLMGQLGRTAGSSAAASLLGGEGVISRLMGDLTSTLFNWTGKIAYAKMFKLQRFGAQVAPMARHRATDDLTTLGRDRLAMVTDIRQYTNTNEKVVLDTVEQLARLGIVFDETGGKAAAYALSADKLLVLQKGTTQQLIASAVKDYGESWEDAAKVIEDTTQASEHWKNVADATHSSTAQALSSNDTLLQMYAKIREGAKGTSLEMVGMNKVFLALADSMQRSGIKRLDIMGNVAGDFLSKLAPATSDFTLMVTQGTMLHNFIEMAPGGSTWWKDVDNIMKDLNLPPIASNIGLSRLLASDPSKTTEFAGLTIAGMSRWRDALPGDITTQNMTLLRYLTDPRFGRMDQITASSVMKFMGRYTEALQKVGDPAKAFEVVRQGEGGADFKKETGKDVNDILVGMGTLGPKQLSAGENLSIAAERMQILDGKTFWPKWTDVVRAARQKEAHRERLLNERALGIPLGAPVMYQPGAGAFPQGDQGGMQPEELTYPTGTYSKSTAMGTEQVDSFVRGTKVGIAAAEFSGPAARQAGSAYRQLGKEIWDPKSRYYGDRAYGKYQVMGKNIPKWAKEAGLGPMTPQQFLANPEAQETVASHQVERIHREHPDWTPADIESWWLSGKPLKEATALGRKDLVTGISPAQYASKGEAARHQAGFED